MIIKQINITECLPCYATWHSWRTLSNHYSICPLLSNLPSGLYLLSHKGVPTFILTSRSERRTKKQGVWRSFSFTGHFQSVIIAFRLIVTRREWSLKAVQVEKVNNAPKIPGRTPYRIWYGLDRIWKFQVTFVGFRDSTENPHEKTKT